MSAEVSKIACSGLVSEDYQNVTVANTELRFKLAANDNPASNFRKSLLKVSEDLKILEISDDVGDVDKCLNEFYCKPAHNGDQQSKIECTLDPLLNINTTAVVETDTCLPEMVTNRGVRTVRRTMSESCSNVNLKKGILKYPRGWRRRTLSESNCDTNFSCDEFDSENFSATESIPELTGYDGDSQDEKPKKNVRFSERISKTMFRMNSSILGRKMKNQKRAKRRKGQVKEATSQNSSVEDVSLEKHDEPPIIASQMLAETNGDSDPRLRQDSGYDSEECAKCDPEDTWHEVVSKRNRRRRNRNCTQQLHQTAV